MAVSKVTICNIALSKLGASRIISLDDESEEAVLCGLYYEPTVDEVLRSHPWNCAKHRQSLAQLSDTDPNYLLKDSHDFQYQFQKPTDPYCLRVLKIIDQPDAVYSVEGNYILANLEKITISYIKRIEDTTKFDALLVKAIAYRLAADLAIDITNSETRKQQMLALYELQKTRAASVDGEESSQIEPENEEWINAGR